MVKGVCLFHCHIPEKPGANTKQKYYSTYQILRQMRVGKEEKGKLLSICELMYLYWQHTSCGALQESRATHTTLMLHQLIWNFATKSCVRT